MTAEVAVRNVCVHIRSTIGRVLDRPASRTRFAVIRDSGSTHAS
jgi:hypothetical protein